jgi:hypothetical protein
MLRAWATARHNAKHLGGSVRLYIAAALRQAWAAAKALAQRTAESNARVQAEIERIRAFSTKEAVAQRATDMAGWQARCGMPTRSYGRRAWR